MRIRKKKKMKQWYNTSAEKNLRVCCSIVVLLSLFFILYFIDMFMESNGPASVVFRSSLIQGYSRLCISLFFSAFYLFCSCAIFRLHFVRWLCFVCPGLRFGALHHNWNAFPNCSFVYEFFADLSVLSNSAQTSVRSFSLQHSRTFGLF